MKMLSSYVVAAVALVPSVLAQVGSVLDLPQCGQQVILEAIQTTGCPLTDVPCMCNNQAFVDELVEQIPLVCSADDIALTAQGAVDICFAYGVTVTIPEELTGGNSTATGTDGVPATTAAETTSEPSETVTPASTSTSSETVPTSETEAPASETPTPTESSAAAEETAAEAENGASSKTVSLSALAGAALLGLVLVYL